jgi:transcriptional regulator with XRE-family HTH domain
MAHSFGEVLRESRRNSGKTIGDVARLLELSTVYVSDVERGNRRPFTRDRILKIADFLTEDPGELLKAADRERGVIEYDVTTATDLAVEIVGGLVTGLARGGISDEKLQKIGGILREDDK